MAVNRDERRRLAVVWNGHSATPRRRSILYEIIGSPTDDGERVRGQIRRRHRHIWREIGARFCTKRQKQESERAAHANGGDTPSPLSRRQDVTSRAAARID